uniref:MAGUK p55 scaffold protein 4 n=2 Tax=Xiphophorus TaxID=8082 RepID=M4A1H2_XIPMA
MPDELPDDEEATRIVCLVKNKQPLGATIKRNDITGEIFVARVIHGGLADRSLLHAGDRIIEVNGFPVDGMEPEQVIQVVARSHGTIMFKVIPITERPIHNQTMLYVRAMTDYSPQQDPTIPCADAGMSFKKGDILEIVDQTDALWWQAKKLPGSSACAGLIPSTSLLKKQREFWWSQPYQPHVCMQICIRLCRRRSQSTTQPSSHIRCPSSCSSLPNNPYEEVVRYQRHPEDTHRVIALISSGVGVNELRRRLIEMSPNIFQGAIPATRSPRGYEESGREYYFTSREIFDHMISNNFLEFGEYKGNLYGTSIDAVKDVLNSGKICVVDIEPNVRTHELRAYIIYVKPPPLERLRETRQDSYITTNYYVNRPFKDEDFHEMEESARKIEAQYWQFFDQVIVNDELQDSCVQLLTAVRKAQDEPQWVPACWIRPT